MVLFAVVVFCCVLCSQLVLLESILCKVMWIEFMDLFKAQNHCIYCTLPSSKCDHLRFCWNHNFQLVMFSFTASWQSNNFKWVNTAIFIERLNMNASYYTWMDYNMLYLWNLRISNLQNGLFVSLVLWSLFSQLIIRKSLNGKKPRLFIKVTYYWYYYAVWTSWNIFFQISFSRVLLLR